MKIEKIVIHGKEVNEQIIQEIKSLVFTLTQKHTKVVKNEDILPDIPSEDELYRELMGSGD